LLGTAQSVPLEEQQREADKLLRGVRTILVMDTQSGNLKTVAKNAVEPKEVSEIVTRILSRYRIPLKLVGAFQPVIKAPLKDDEALVLPLITLTTTDYNGLNGLPEAVSHSVTVELALFERISLTRDVGVTTTFKTWSQSETPDNVDDDRRAAILSAISHLVEKLALDVLSANR
jgi:hypothetical protein